MYPYLTPSGLIFELHPQPLGRLSRETMEKDMDYWKKLTGELIGDWLDNNTSVEKVCDFADKVFLQKNLSGFKGDAAFAKNEEAQKCFSKLRSSIGGLYVWRSENGNDTEEKKQAQSNADLAFRQAYALCPYSPEVVFRYANLLENLRRHDDAVLMVKTSVRLSPDDKQFQDLLRSLTRR
jgi:predicted Zn-dependent protease